MQTNTKLYDLSEGVGRIDEILTSSDADYQETDRIPARDGLTYTNGFYVNCSCVYIDIRGSSKLPKSYKNPTLARLYRAYISECVAVLNSDVNCSEINIHGDGIWGVFNTPFKPDVDSTFATAARLASVVKILNCRLAKKTPHIEPVTVGIGCAYGRALMLKAGYKGSAINDVVWMGDVVNQAAKLSDYGNSDYSCRELGVSTVFYDNLNETNKALLSKVAYSDRYHGDVINVAMDEWIKVNCR